MLARLDGGSDEAALEQEIKGWVTLPEPYVAFLAEEGGTPLGLIDCRVRNYAEGAPGLRAAYVEDLWVEPTARKRGVGKALLRAVESWARDQGVDWLGSDALFDNETSHAWHRACGFAEVERIVVFGKPL